MKGEGKRLHRKLEKFKERLTNASYGNQMFTAHLSFPWLCKRPEDSQGQMMAFLFSCFCRVARQTYTLAVVIEGDTYYSRDVCEPGGRGVSFCPGNEGTITRGQS